MTIKVNNKYGTKIGGIQVFTKERAEEVYKIFVARCYEDLTPESSAVLAEIEDEMHRIGFSFSELEEMEISVIREKAN